MFFYVAVLCVVAVGQLNSSIMDAARGIIILYSVLFALLKLQKVVKQFKVMDDANLAVVRLVKLLSINLFVSHVVACFWHMIISFHDENSSWIHNVWNS